MRDGLFNATVWYSLISLSALLSTFLVIKHRTKFLKHMIVPTFVTVAITVLVLSITVGGESYKYVSDSFAIIWLVSTIIASYSLRRTNRG
jgi:hypothetical protein